MQLKVLKKIKTTAHKQPIKKEIPPTSDPILKYPIIEIIPNVQSKTAVRGVRLMDEKMKDVSDDHVTDVSADILVESSADGIMSMGKHQLITINRPRVKGFCVECIKKNQDPHYKSNMIRIRTYCPECPGGNWICETCFVEYHTNMIAS